MNSLPPKKYGISPNEIEKNKEKIYRRKKLKLGVSLKVGEEVLILSARLKRKDSPGKFYKSSIENKPPYFDKDKTYFNKDKLFQITNRENIAGKNIYWVKNTKTEKKLKN